MTNLTDAPTVLSVPSAHGITFGNDHVYITNIAGGGDDAIYTIALASQTIVGGGMMDPVDGLPPTPHNVAVAGSSLFITHSGGAATQVESGWNNRHGRCCCAVHGWHQPFWYCLRRSRPVHEHTDHLAHDRWDHCSAH
jgi:hypothetical protein